MQPTNVCTDQQKNCKRKNLQNSKTFVKALKNSRMLMR